MKITHRLYLAALPALIGVLAVAALGYWGQYDHAIPEVILAIAAITVLATLALSWVNVRYVTRRVERLAHGKSARQLGGANSAPSRDSRDELDTIEGKVLQLNAAVLRAEGERAREVAVHRQRMLECTSVMDGVAVSAARALNEVRLPLHILLENHFGELNENQEEMLGAARVAAEDMSAELRVMGDLARLAAGRLPLRQDRIFLADILASILPTVRTESDARGIACVVDVMPLVPALRGDAMRLKEALEELLVSQVQHEGAKTCTLRLFSEGHAVFITFTPARDAPFTIQRLFATEVIRALGGSVTSSEGTLLIQFDSRYQP